MINIKNLKLLLLFFLGWVVSVTLLYYYPGSVLTIAIAVLLILQTTREFFQFVNDVRLTQMRERRYIMFALVLTVTSVYLFTDLTTLAVRKADIVLQQGRRMRIVNDVRAGLIQPLNGYRYATLPAGFPPLSIQQNEIIIDREPGKYLRVSFWIDDPFFTMLRRPKLVYSDDTTFNKNVELLCEKYPELNQKVGDNWYITDYYPGISYYPDDIFLKFQELVPRQ